jgi:hypothetical protein
LKRKFPIILPARRVPALLIPTLPPTGLWTPPVPGPSPVHYWAVTLGLKDILGKRWSLREIGRQLGGLDRLSLAILLSKMDILMAKVSFAQRPALDMMFVRSMCDDAVRRGAARFIGRQRRQASRYYFFNEQQVLRLMLMTLAYSKRGRRKVDRKEDLAGVAKLLLAINEHLDPLQSYGPRLASLPADEQRRLFVEMVLRNGIFNHQENFAAALVRHWELFVRLPMERGDLPIDVRQAFREAAGVAPATYVAIAFGLFAHWTPLTLETADKFPMGIDPVTYFANSKFRGPAKRILRKLSAPAGRLVRQYTKECAELGSVHYAFRAFAERPLVRLSRRRVLCGSWRHLQKKLTENLYYEVLSGLASEAKRSRFQEAFGKLLEEYVRRLLRRIYGIGTGRLFELTYGPDRAEAGDGIVLYPESLVIFEVKSARFLVGAAATGDLEEFERKLNHSYLKGAQQIDRVIRDFNAGLFQVGGLGPGEIRRYFPVLVTIQPIPLEVFVWKLIEEKLRNGLILQGDGIQRLEIIHISELEEVEALATAGHSFLELLERKQDHPIYRDWSFRNFLHNHVGGEIPPNEYLRERFDEIGRFLKRLHFGTHKT